MFFKSKLKTVYMIRNYTIPSWKQDLMDIFNKAALECSAKISTEESGRPGFFQRCSCLFTEKLSLSFHKLLLSVIGHYHLKSSKFLLSAFCSQSILNLKEMEAFRKLREV